MNSKTNNISSFLKKFLNVILFGNFFVATCITAFSFSTFYLIQSTVNYYLLLFIFSSSLFLYTLHRLKCVSQFVSATDLRQERYNWVRNNKSFSMAMLMIFGFITSLLTFYLNKKHLIILIPLGFISILYSYPLIKINGQSIRLRDIKGIKLILIAGVVTVVTYGLPLISAQTSLSFSHFLGSFDRFLFLLAITIPFDIRDLEFDQNSIKTLPSVVGVRNSKLIAILILLLHFMLAIIIYHCGVINLNGLFALGITDLIAISFFLIDNKNKSEYFYAFSFEGLMLIQCAFIFVFNFLIK